MTTIRVAPGEDLQSAINRSTWGDVIALVAGGVYKAPQSAFTWPNKPGGTGTDADYITITTEGWAKTGRVTNGAGMAKIVAIAGRGAFQVAANSKYLRLQGLEITNQSSGTAQEHVQDLLGSVDGGYHRHSKPHHFIVDQCYIHPQEDGLPTSDPNYNFRTVSHGIAWNVADLTVSNSRLSGFFGSYRHGQNVVIDSEAIAYSGGPGSLIVYNNYIDAWYAGILTGGADTDSDNFGSIASAQSASTFSINLLGGSLPVAGDMIAVANPEKEYSAARVKSVSGNEVTCEAPLVWNGLMNAGLNDGMTPAPIPVTGSNVKWRGYVMKDISITRNDFHIDPTFAQFWRTRNGSNPKGYIEFKNGVNILLDGNTFDGWPAIVGFGLQNQSGSAPWSQIRNVIITNNLWKRYSYVVGFSVTGYSRLTETGGNITIANNLAYGNGASNDVNGHASAFFPLSGSPMDGPLRIEHNTIIDHSSGWAVQVFPIRGDGIYRDNILYGKNYGHQCLPVGPRGKDCYSNLISDKNIIVNTLRLNPVDINSYWWPNSIVVTDTSEVGFANPAQHDYRLLSTSPGFKTSTDGKDVGVDIDQLYAHLSGEITAPIPEPLPPDPPIPPPPDPPPPDPAPEPPVPEPPPAPSPVISGFVLVNAATNNDIGPLVDGGTIDLRLVGKELNVRAEASAGPITFELDGVIVRTELSPPFALGGDNNGDYEPWTPVLGSHTLRALSGSASLEINFSVIQSAEPVPEPPPPVPTPEPPPQPEPVSEPPLPPAPPCSISAVPSISVRRNTAAVIVVRLENMSGPTTVTVLGSDGQVTVSPLNRTVSGSSASLQFNVKVKKQSRTIIFESPCGSATVKVNVT